MIHKPHKSLVVIHLVSVPKVYHSHYHIITFLSRFLLLFSVETSLVCSCITGVIVFVLYSVVSISLVNSVRRLQSLAEYSLYAST